MGWSFIRKGTNLSGVGTFKTIQTPSGTSPVATGLTDTLTLTSSDNSITITGNSATDTIDLIVASAPSSGGLDLVSYTQYGGF